MAPTATQRLRLLKQEEFTNPDAWGGQLNTGALDMADEAWALAEITVDDDVNLVPQNFLSDDARRLVLMLSGAGGKSVTHPQVDKPYIVVNACAADVTIAPDGGGAGAVVRAGTWAIVVCDGTDDHVLDLPLNKIKAPSAAVDFNSQKATGLAAPENAGDAATKGYVDGRKVTDLTAPTSDFSMNGQKITGLADPVDPQDAATRNYIDTLASSGNLAIVASIADDITVVASMTGQVTVVAGLADEIATVAGISAAVTQLADMYLGASATDPTTRLDGSPLQSGDYYLNTTGTPTFRAFNGAGWNAIEVPEIASEAEARAGSDNTKMMTPLRTHQAIDEALEDVGAWTLIASSTVSTPVSEVVFTSISQGWKRLRIVADAGKHNHSSNSTILAQWSADNGSNYNTLVTSASAANTAFLFMDIEIDNYNGATGRVITARAVRGTRTGADTPPYAASGEAQGTIAVATALNAVRFVPNNSQISGGTYSVYAQ